ncbi:MAG: hypothetical protein AAFP00_13065, partial [Bacteroidota bacterium]
MSGYTIRLSPNRRLTPSEIIFHGSLRVTVKTRKSQQSNPTESSSPPVDEAIAEIIVDDDDGVEVVTDAGAQVTSSGSDSNPNISSRIEIARESSYNPAITLDTEKKVIPGLEAVYRALDVNPNELIRFGKFDQLGILELKD